MNDKHARRLLIACCLVAIVFTLLLLTGCTDVKDSVRTQRGVIVRHERTSASTVWAVRCSAVNAEDLCRAWAPFSASLPETYVLVLDDGTNVTVSATQWMTQRDGDVIADWSI